MKVELRDPNTIMKLSRLGSFHQSKLSFLRSFLSEFKDWEYKRDLFNLDQNGYGEAVYSFKKKDRVYSLVCFANEIKDEERSDRVIATKWDAAFTLHDGTPNSEDINRLKNEVPKQEVGRLSFKELTLSRANKSVRVFNHVVESLSEGSQPDLDLLSKVGYLYRTTAVYGSGKFGLADRFRIKNREEINGPFRLEMMLVYLVRQFTFDQVNHVAYFKNPKKAVKLDKRICKNILQSGKQCKTLAHLKKYKGYCFHCYFKINPDEIPVRNIKIKEQAVVDYIDELYSKNYDIIYDKPIGNTNKSPDIVMNCENYVIIIEVDEFQHKKNSYKGGHYSKENEENKMKIIRDYFKTQNKKTIYLRFNPDDYLSKDNIKIKSPWKEDEDKLLVIVDETDWNNRLAKLKEKVDYYLKKNTIKNNSTKYLFYE